MDLQYDETTFRWEDTDTYETVRLVAKAYGLSVSRLRPISPRSAEVTLSGNYDRVARLSCDMRCLGIPEPFFAGCPAIRSDYLVWLQAELKIIGIDFVPKPATAV